MVMPLVGLLVTPTSPTIREATVTKKNTLRVLGSLDVLQILLNVINGALSSLHSLLFLEAGESAGKHHGCGFRHEHNLIANFTAKQIGRCCFAATGSTGEHDAATVIVVQIGF